MTIPDFIGSGVSLSHPDKARTTTEPLHSKEGGHDRAAFRRGNCKAGVPVWHTMRYPYTTIELPASPTFPSGRKLVRPLVEIVVAGHAAPALVDTGATACVFHTSWLSRFSLNPSEGRVSSAATGGFGDVPGLVYHFDVKLEIKDLAVFETSVGFTNIVQSEYGVLGFHGFLDRVDADFREDYFELISRTAYPPVSEDPAK